MSKPGSTRVIAAFPQELPGTFIDELRASFDPLASLVPPHLTVVFPFISALTTQELRAQVQEVLAEHATFSLRLDEVTAHGEYLFLNVKRGNDDLIALHDLLYARVLPEHLDSEFTFVPHVTLGRVEHRPTRLAALSGPATSANLLRSEWTD